MIKGVVIMNRINRQVAIIIVFALIMCSFSPAVVAEEDETGSFYLMACTEYETLIEPTAVSYTAGQSIREALLTSGFSFGGLEERNYIETVEGVSGNFAVFYDNNGYDLSASADSITVLCVTEAYDSYSPEVVALIARMGQLNEMPQGVRAYVSSEYTAALRGVQAGVSSEQALALLESLNAAIAAYEEMLDGDKYTVSFNVSDQEGEPAEGFSVRLTDVYGNVYTSDTAQIPVIAGQYDFVVSSGYNRTEGTVNVGADTELNVTLPSKEWFGRIRAYTAAGVREASQDNSTHTVRLYVEDMTANLNGTGLTLYVVAGTLPDAQNTELYKTYTNTQGQTVSSQVSWGSTTNSLAGLLDNSMTGNTAVLEAIYVDSSGYRMIQSYYLEFIRVPTLSVIRVEDSQGVNYLSSFSPVTKTYSLTVPSGEYQVIGTPYLDEAYSVSVNGGTSVETVSITEGLNTVTVNVSHENEHTSNYTLNITGAKPSKVYFNVPEETSLEVFTTANSLILPGSDGGYDLIPGNVYYYISTRDIYYQTSARFMVSEGLTVNVAEPDTNDALSDFAMYDLSSPNLRSSIFAYSEFSSSCHEYLYLAEDAITSLSVQATINPDSRNYKVYARYNYQRYNSTGPRSIMIGNSVSSIGPATSLTTSLIAGGYPQTVTVALEKTENGITYTQIYVMRIARKVQLRDLKPTVSGNPLLLYNEMATTAVSFDREVTSYCVMVSKYNEEIEINGAFTNETQEYLFGGGYSAMIGGQIYTDISEGIPVRLDPNSSEETIEITVLHEDEYAVPTTYTIRVKKFEPVPVSFDVAPQDAVVFVTDGITGKPIYPEDGAYAMEPGRSYLYTITKSGFVGQTGTYTATDSADRIPVTLTAAPENTDLQDLNAEWPYFRADADNNGVVDYKTPTVAENTVLYWATKAGEGWGGQACGCPILVDGYLYIYASTSLYKVDTVTGKVVATGTMDRASSFAINSPAYAEGMIFVGLSNGGVQAFDAVTLQPLWIYNDPIKAQPNCPIVFHDGYIYTGFWKGETMEASFVCLSVTDENPNSRTEEKLPTWRHVQKGGFYWAGAYVCDDFLLVGTDDGESGYVTGYSQVLSFDPKTGEMLSSITLPHVGDLRSSIAHDTETGDYYFTTKGGYFYRLSVNADGTIDDESLRYVKLDNYADDPNNPPMSTGTPVIYNGRAYIGVSGTGQFLQYSGHSITVIDLNSMRIAYKVRTQGFPQTSGLLTTAYDEGDGTVYIYFVDNMTPGKLRVISDRPGQNEPKEVTQETFSDKTGTHVHDTAYVLFTPTGGQAEFAICSPIADETGTIYFKNDSGCLMAIGPTIDRLEMTTMPDKTSYDIGEKFDPNGMKVTAYYSNGTSRDVTNYVTYSKDALGADDTEFEIRFDYVMYQNIGDEAGVIYDAPSVILDLTIGSSAPALLGDINGDGTVNATDVSEFISLISKDEAPEIAIGDINGDGTVNVTDISELIQKITSN